MTTRARRSQEFIAQADAICQKADKDQTAVVGKETGGMYQNFSDTAYLSQYNAVTRDALKRLRALDAPEGDRNAVDDLLTALEQNVAAVDKRVAALRARDLPSQSQAMRDFQTSYGDVVSSAGALDLTQCQALGAEPLKRRASGGDGAGRVEIVRRGGSSIPATDGLARLAGMSPTRGDAPTPLTVDAASVAAKEGRRRNAEALSTESSTVWTLIVPLALAPRRW